MTSNMPGRKWYPVPSAPGRDLKLALDCLHCDDAARGVLGEACSSVEYEERHRAARVLEERLLPMPVWIRRLLGLGSPRPLRAGRMQYVLPRIAPRAPCVVGLHSWFCLISPRIRDHPPTACASHESPAAALRWRTPRTPMPPAPPGGSGAEPPRRTLSSQRMWSCSRTPICRRRSVSFAAASGLCLALLRQASEDSVLVQQVLFATPAEPPAGGATALHHQSVPGSPNATRRGSWRSRGRRFARSRSAACRRLRAWISPPMCSRDKGPNRCVTLQRRGQGRRLLSNT